MKNFTIRLARRIIIPSALSVIISENIAKIGTGSWI